MGFLYVSLGNPTSNVQRIQGGTFLGTSAPVVLIHKANPQIALEQQTENKSAANFVDNVYEQMNIDTNANKVLRLNSSFYFPPIRPDTA